MTDKANAPYPYLGINGEFFSKEFLESVERELQHKAATVWSAGLDKPSPCEQFAYRVLKQISMKGI
jgi:hypothetical protein